MARPLREINRALPARPASRLALAAYVAWALALTIGSLFPISSWTARGIDPFEFLREPWPRWWTTADVALNVVAYLPLGLLGGFALWPRWRGALAVLLVTSLGATLSLALEALQNWLPTRIPSRLDLSANALGTLLGALLGVFLAPRWGAATALGRWPDRWLHPAGQSAWLLLIAWLLAQSGPQVRLFGAGNTPLAWQTIGIPIAERVGWSALTVATVLESVTVIAALTSVMLIVQASTRASAPRAAIAAFIVALALVARTTLEAAAIPEDASDHWASAGALGGLLCGALVALGAASLGPEAQQRALLGALCTLLVAGQIRPELAFHNAAATAWSSGPWRNVAGFQEGLANLWPLLALAWAARRRL